MADEPADQRRSISFREMVASVITRMDVPLGYTLTIWSSGSAAQQHLGKPELPQVITFVGGAAVAYVLLAYTLGLAPPSMAEQPIKKTASFALFNVLAAFIAVVSSVLATAALPEGPGYFMVGFLATFVFLLALAAFDFLGVRLGMGRKSGG